MRTIDEFIIHCSASNWGDMAIICEWHIARGWDTGGYHYYIGNCYPLQKHWELKTPIFSNDGILEAGRKIEVDGAHTRGHNKRSIGICLIGNRSFTMAQFLTLQKLIRMLSSMFPDAKVKTRGHYEHYSGKTCPNINMNFLRKALEAKRLPKWNDKGVVLNERSN